MENCKIKKISLSVKDRLINKQEFKIYENIWHYSFNDILSKNFYKLSDKEGRINIVKEPFDAWSPVLLYLNYDGPPLVRTKNLIDSAYDKSGPEGNKVFWYLALSTFEDYLKRRDRLSAHPNTNFPSSKTYNDLLKKVHCTFNIEKLDRDFFFSTYNKLKNDNHQTGEVVLELLTRNVFQLPADWLKMGYLTHNNNVVAIALIVDDLKSASIYNAAARRSNKGYGLLLFIDIIKYYCDHNYYSIDGGVSGKYGVYKDKLFLDSKTVIEDGDCFYCSDRSQSKYDFIRNIYHALRKQWTNQAAKWLPPLKIT